MPLFALIEVAVNASTPDITVSDASVGVHRWDWQGVVCSCNVVDAKMSASCKAQLPRSVNRSDGVLIAVVGDGTEKRPLRRPSVSWNHVHKVCSC